MKTPQEIIKELLNIIGYYAGESIISDRDMVKSINEAKEYLAKPQSEPTEAEIERVAKVIAFALVKQTGGHTMSNFSDDSLVSCGKCPANCTEIAKAAIKAMRDL